MSPAFARRPLSMINRCSSVNVGLILFPRTDTTAKYLRHTTSKHPASPVKYLPHRMISLQPRTGEVGRLQSDPIPRVVRELLSSWDC